MKSLAAMGMVLAAAAAMTPHSAMAEPGRGKAMREGPRHGPPPDMEGKEMRAPRFCSMEPKPAMIERMRKRMAMGRTLKVSGALDLNEADALKLSKIFGKYDEERFAIRMEQRKHLCAIYKLFEENAADEKAYAAAVDGMLAARKKLQDMQQREIAELRTQLTPKQQARLMLAIPEMMREAMKLHGKGKWGRHGGGWGPPEDGDAGEE
ncbi:MAG: hypothetical protein GMKNLPBB_02367 [Myxococcota bacterium]|nr:hypothetical protein [Myxococcota bacterium]